MSRQTVLSLLLSSDYNYLSSEVSNKALGISTEGMLHSYCSSSTCASCSLEWSEVRPHFVQYHFCLAGFHLMFPCFIG